MKPFRLLKDSELRRLEQKVNLAASGWASRWALRPVGEITWTVGAAGLERIGASLLPVDCGDDLHGVIGLAEDEGAALAGLALGQPGIAKGHAVARELALLCLADWLATFAGAAEVRPLPAPTLGELTRRGSGAALICCRLGGRVLGTVLLPLGLLQRIGVVSAAGSPAPQAKLHNRAASALPARLRLTATLGDTALTIKELREISVGDVLILDHSLETPLALRLGGAQVGRAYPGVQDGRVGVELSK